MLEILPRDEKRGRGGGEREGQNRIHPELNKKKKEKYLTDKSMVKRHTTSKTRKKKRGKNCKIITQVSVERFKTCFFKKKTCVLCFKTRFKTSCFKRANPVT